MELRLPPVTLALLIALAAGYGLQLLLGDGFSAPLALWPLGPHVLLPQGGGVDSVGFEIWQLVSYGFLHGSGLHLAFNAFALYMFGSPIEQLWGSRPFLVYYLVCVVGAALAQLATQAWLMPDGPMIPTVGASGGVFGLLLAFGMMYPHQRVLLLFPPIPMPAWLFVIGYGVLELVLGLSQPGSNVAHFAHLGGMAIGFVLIQYWRGKLPWRPRRILMR